MKFKRWIVLFAVLGAAAFTFAGFYQFLRHKALTSEFKTLTENKIGQILRARVHIGQIKIGLLKHISLAGLRVTTADSKSVLSIGVKKIIIRYDLMSLLKRKLSSPKDIFLDSPELRFQSLVSPFSIVPLLISPEEARSLAHFEFNKGEIEFPIPGLFEKLKIEEIEGKAFFDGSGRLNLNVQARAGELADGLMNVRGFVEVGAKSGNLEIEFKDLTFLPGTNIPIAHLYGNISLSHTKAVIRQLRFQLRGLPCELSGEVENIFSPQPSFKLSWRLLEGSRPTSLDLESNLADQSIHGKLVLLGRKFGFDGVVTSDPTGIQLHDLAVDNGFRAYGSFDLKTSKVQLRAERDEQRYSTDLSVKDFNVNFNLDFSHLPIAGHDLTAFAKLRMKPIEAEWAKGNHQLQASVETDYFIVDRHPLQDFQSSFQISPYGLSSMTARWKGISELKGSVAFGHPSALDLTLLVGGLDLTHLRYLGSHRMPASLHGMLTGKLMMKGPVREPDITGQFSVQDGKIGEFDYDYATLHFHGLRSFLTLDDSKVVKKDKTFGLRGSIDFNSDNIFERVEVVSMGQIVVWKGLRLGRELKRASIEENHQSHFGEGGSQESGREEWLGGSKVGMDYAFSGKRSISVAAEEDDNGNQMVKVGPKLKF